MFNLCLDNFFEFYLPYKILILLSFIKKIAKFLSDINFLLDCDKK